MIILLTAILAFVWGNSFIPVEKSNDISDKIADAVKPVVEPITVKNVWSFYHNFRKYAHFIEFFLLGVILTLLKFNNKKFNIFAVLFISLAVGVTDESIQIISNRSPMVQDVLIDFCGAMTGMAMIFAIYYIIKFINKGKSG